MSRNKRRKERKQKERKLQSRLQIGGAVLAIMLIVGTMLFFLNNPSQESFSEDGRPIWHTIELTDARTGESFTLADFDERDVVVKITSLY